MRERLAPFAAGLAAQRRDDQDVVEIDARATALIEAIDYIELSDRADFNDLFVDELAFPGS